jgi:hypothetical protein
LERWESDTLRLVAPASAGAAIPLTTLHRLQVSRGTRGHARLGGAIGALVGVALGLAIASGSDCPQGFLEFCFERVLAPLGAMTVGWGPGAGVGASIRTEQWWEIRLPAGRAQAFNSSETPSP